ncbi:MAG: hypothetical protein BWZ10_03040 [candidate division BRC1 bacterium ADurb.BinA364]|nr:MAG: hypothetical protein BWZ10_03040 [candidate division BRC1 bacterium ADurb.BinA364]
MHWVNADINPHCFPGFLARAAEEGLGGRVSAIFADAQALPFRDGYARIVVSRGSLQFWGDLKLGLSEVYRTLAPGGAAFIGRGLPRDMPPDVARTVREGHSKEGKGGPPPYDPDETARQLAEIMEEFGVKDYTVHRPRIEGAEDVNYGVWLEFHKPAEE